MLQVRGFTAQTGAVIHDLAVYFASGKIYKAQDSPSIRANGAQKRNPYGSHNLSAERLFYIITDGSGGVFILYAVRRSI
jgi:hypothetical protein